MAGYLRMKVAVNYFSRPHQRGIPVAFENSPAIHGWENREAMFQVPLGTAELFFRP
jgi:hypothetical protein